MKKWILRAFLLGILGISIYFGVIFYGQYQNYLERKEFEANVKPSASPNVSVFKNFVEIPYRNERRTIHVYTPPGYANDTTVKYPVIYMMDGESSFDDMANMAPEWQIDEVIDSIAGAGGPAAIVVGIEQAEDRDAEYTPWPIEDVPHAHGEAYANWLVNGLKPLIDSTYRTRTEAEATTIGGISRSGMMAYYVLMAHPERFGNALIQSPSMWVDEDRLLAMIEERPPGPTHRFFVSAGEEEQVMAEQAKRLHDRLREGGVAPARLRFEIIEGLGHQHKTWRESFARAYPWIIRE